jgi:hypothetical protein
MINQKFMKLCTLQDPNMKMCNLVVYPGTKFGGNRTKDVEVGPDRQTDRPISYIPLPPNYVCGEYKYNTECCVFVVL